MKKCFSTFLSCIIFLLIMVSCQENGQSEEEQKTYHYRKESLYTSNDSSSESIVQYQYFDNTLYGLVRYLSEDAERYDIVTMDLISGVMDSFLEKGDIQSLDTIHSFAFDHDKNLWILSSDESQYYLIMINDGIINEQIMVDYIMSDSEINWAASTLYIDDEKRFYCSFDSQNIFLINSNGMVLNEISVNGLIKSFMYMNEKVFVTYSGDLGFSIAEYIVESAELAEPSTVVQGIGFGDFSSAEPLDMSYCYYDTNGMNVVDMQGNPNQLFSWPEHGWGEYYPSKIFMTEMGDILCCNENEIVKMKRVSAEEGDQRQKLTLAAFDAGEALKYLVADFNKTSETHLISIVDYNLYNTDTDKYAGLTKLNTEIIGGNPPDMIDLRNIDAQQYIVMGVLEDLYPYMDHDTDLDRNNYLPNVLNAMGDGIALYGVTTTFRVNTVAAKTSQVDTKKWNLQGLQEMLAANPEAYLGGTKMGMLELACDYMQDHFVDWEAKTAKFDSPEFLSFLEACNTLPEETEVREIYNLYFDHPDYPASYVSAFVSDFSNAKEHEEIWGEPISYIGFPEAGSTISLRMHVGMLSGGENKDAVWSFLRTALLPKAQMENAEFIMGFPIKKNSFEQATQQALAPEDDGTEYLVDGTTGESMELTYPTQEQVNKVAELAKSTDKLASVNTVIKDIVLEEAAPYFAGNKTAAETASVIQNRVTTYMGEQMK